MSLKQNTLVWDMLLGFFPIKKKHMVPMIFP